jgi:ubiquinone biosynthesis protein UbiJ
MSEISKYQRSQQAIAEMIVHLWRQSMLAFKDGNIAVVNEFNNNIDQLKSAVNQIDNKLKNIKNKS